MMIFLIASFSGCGSKSEKETGGGETEARTGESETGTRQASTEKSTFGNEPTGEYRIGIAWYPDTEIEFISNIVRSIEEAGGECVILDEVRSADVSYDETGFVKEVEANGALSEAAAGLIRKNTWHGSNVEEVMKDVSFVIFPGGEDISPTLHSVKDQESHIEEEEYYNANRDVSDYLAMTYCLDQDIPVMGVCRGMHVLAVVSGAEMILDIPTYFEGRGVEYKNEHRNALDKPDGYRDYTPHDVTVSRDSLLYKIVDGEKIEKCPSWHHQAVKSVKGTPLVVTGSTDTDGIQIIEAIERTDKTFALGIQFHPEAAVTKHLDHMENENIFMSKDKALSFFRWIINREYLATDEAA